MFLYAYGIRIPRYPSPDAALEEIEQEHDIPCASLTLAYHTMLAP
jgi:hypothetical protein